MKLKLPLYFILLFVCAFSLPAYAGSPIWKVSDGSHHLYIGGTVHVLSKNDYPLPETFNKAYKQSEVLVFEMDMDEMHQPSFQKETMKQLTYPAGRSLRSVLNIKTYKALNEHCLSLGFTASRFDHYKVGFIASVLMMIEMKKLGIDAQGVDKFYYNIAKGDKKRIGALETGEEQLAFLATLGEGSEDDFVIQILSEMNNLSENITETTHAWRYADLAKLKQIALLPLQKYPQVYDALIIQRNQAWLPKITAMLETKEVEFVLVGMLHLVGEDSLLQQLKKDGYTIESYK